MTSNDVSTRLIFSKSGCCHWGPSVPIHTRRSAIAFATRGPASSTTTSLSLSSKRDQKDQGSGPSHHHRGRTAGSWLQRFAPRKDRESRVLLCCPAKHQEAFSHVFGSLCGMLCLPGREKKRTRHLDTVAVGRRLLTLSQNGYGTFPAFSNSAFTSCTCIYHIMYMMYRYG